MVKLKKPFLAERREELNRKEWIAFCLLVDKTRKRLRAHFFAVQRLRDHLLDSFMLERCEQHLVYPSPGAADRTQDSPERVGWADFVVTIGTDEQQMPNLGMCGEMLQHLQCCRVQPLQIV